MRDLLRRFVCFALGHMYGINPSTQDENGKGYVCLRCERKGLIIVYGHKAIEAPLRRKA